MKITSEKSLRELYDLPSERAVKKVLSSLEKHAINFIQHSPFLVLSSFSKAGDVDASPRGGKPGFVAIIDKLTIAIPDAKGNNRLDSLTNILETGKVGMLFLIPGIDETLRLNGRAVISTDPEFISLFQHESKKPTSVLVVTVETVFMHCAKAFMRSELWNSETHIARESFPTMGEILKDQLDGSGTPESHADMVKRYQQDL